MSVDFKLDAANFNSAMAEMEKRIDAAEFEDIILSETSAVLKKAISLTQKAKKKEIRQAVMKRIPNKNSRGWYKPTGAAARKRSWRIKDAQWKAYLKRKRAEAVERSKRAGLSAQTWLEIGQDLGLRPKAPAGVRKATYQGKPVTHKAQGSRMARGQQRFGVELIYRNPAGRYAGAKSALGRAIRGRAKFFERNLREGVFYDAAQIAAKYPGLKIQSK